MKSWMQGLAAASATLALGLALPASGATCKSLKPTLDATRTHYRQALEESSLANAREGAGRVAGDLAEASAASRDCNCADATPGFDSAAAGARRATESNSLDALSNELLASARQFNEALERIRACRRKAGQ